MKRFLTSTLFIALCVPSFFTVVFAQTAIPADTWGGFWQTQASLVALVLILTAFVRERLSLTGNSVVILSLLIGAALGAFGKLMTFYTGDWPSAILFGLGAGFMASGGWDAVSGLKRSQLQKLAKTDNVLVVGSRNKRLPRSGIDPQ